jgi:high-affinity nickel-transport protein
VRRSTFPDGRLRRRVALIGAALLVWNAAAWLWATLAFKHQPLLIGTALLAYGLGLRHALDADHIAAIDNVTRKLMQQGRRPVSAGLYFSLGHSTVVAALTVVVAVAAASLRHQFAHLRLIGGLVGTSVSALLLFLIAAANLAILAQTWRSFRAARNGAPDAAPLGAPGGVMSRLWRGSFRLIEHSSQMYLVGLLFGLGFDTATEIGLLGVSAASAAKGLSLGAILVLPALFSAGMALIDTADSVVMTGAYGWAFVKPLRKLYYNLTITTLSVLVALVVAALETLGLLGASLREHGIFWRSVDSINGHFEWLGYGIVGLFVLGWLVSLAIYKLARYEAV